jgi:hypothetical protein
LTASWCNLFEELADIERVATMITGRKVSTMTMYLVDNLFLRDHGGKVGEGLSDVAEWRQIILIDSSDIARSWYMEGAGDFVIKYGFGTGKNQKCMSTFF